jgi:hypothetical protein
VEHIGASLLFVDENANDCPTYLDPSILQKYGTVNGSYLGRDNGGCCSTTPSFESQGVSDSYIANQYTNAGVFSSDTAGSDLSQTLLLRCIEEDIIARKTKECGRFDRSVAQRGNVPCTLGCGRLLRFACDRNRHGETVYPQKYWACYLCRHLLNPTSKDLFIRLDKLRAHSARDHLGQSNLNACRIQSVVPLHPKIRELCRYRFDDQGDRERHITTRHSRICRDNHRGLNGRQSSDDRRARITSGAGENQVDADTAYASSDRPDRSQRESVLGRTAAQMPGTLLQSAPCAEGKDDQLVPLLTISGTPALVNQSMVQFTPILAKGLDGAYLPQPRIRSIQYSDAILGKGAFGEVWKASIAIDDTSTSSSGHKSVAIKQFRTRDQRGWRKVSQSWDRETATLR